jgi:hypothetical protein
MRPSDCTSVLFGEYVLVSGSAATCPPSPNVASSDPNANNLRASSSSQFKCYILPEVTDAAVTDASHGAGITAQ